MAQGETGQDIVGERERLLDIGMAAVFATCVVFAVFRLAVSLVTGKATPWWANAAGACAIALLHLWRRNDRARRVQVAVHVTAAVATMALLVPCAYGLSSSKWWLTLVGFSVVLLGRRGEALFWSGVTIVLVPATALLEPYIQVENAVGEPALERAMSGLLFVVLLLAVTRSFRRVADRRARELAETAESLGRANAVKSRFLAHMSHEVRTPLHGVIAMADLAHQGEASPQVHEQIRMAQQSARALLGILNNVLDVSRADAGALQLESRPFLLHTALTEVLLPLAAQARGKGIAFTAQADPGIAEARVGDSVRLGQIVLNLVGNALKFTRQGSIRVRLRAAGSPDRLTIEIADTGQGIPQDKLASIFEPFVQADVADGRNLGGVGLGLAIVRELARLMDGGVSVESDPGRGTSFSLQVTCRLDEPRSSAAGPEELLPASSSPAQAFVERGTQRLSVLVCEDSEINQTVLRMMLTRLGHQAEIVEDGGRAWALLQEKRYDLLLTDVEMPVLDGVALARRIRAREAAEQLPRLPIVGATAHVGEEEQHRLYDAGMDGYLAKPFTLTALSKAIDRVRQS
ncbi:MAG TPA: ATP-binding protein [Myxococcales bacterium]|nr:ATP-binding protein [Myxococcales bacterium]